MRQAFLMTAPIVIEGAVMVVDKGVEEVLDRCPLDPFVSFVLSGLDEDISIFIPAQMDMNVITVYLCGDKVCMERIRPSLSNSSSLSLLDLFENSRARLLIIPLEIVSFPPVISERRSLVLSMETLQ